MSRGLELLESAVGYALAAAAPATAELMRRPTPCPEWDLERLLDHVSGSIEALSEALTGSGALSSGAADPRVGSGGAPADPVARLRRRAIRLLETCAATGPDGRRVAIWDRELTVGMVAVTGALEISVHGWDVSVACGVGKPIPARLAAVLLPIAPLFVTASVRPGLFADPVRLPGPACPGDRLVAFLGRRPGDDSPARHP